MPSPTKPPIPPHIKEALKPSPIWGLRRVSAPFAIIVEQQAYLIEGHRRSQPNDTMAEEALFSDITATPISKDGKLQTEQSRLIYTDEPTRITTGTLSQPATDAPPPSDPLLSAIESTLQSHIQWVQSLQPGNKESLPQITSQVMRADRIPLHTDQGTETIVGWIREAGDGDKKDFEIRRIDTVTIQDGKETNLVAESYTLIPNGHAYYQHIEKVRQGNAQHLPAYTSITEAQNGADSSRFFTTDKGRIAWNDVVGTWQDRSIPLHPSLRPAAPSQTLESPPATRPEPIIALDTTQHALAWLGAVVGSAVFWFAGRTEEGKPKGMLRTAIQWLGGLTALTGAGISLLAVEENWRVNRHHDHTP